MEETGGGNKAHINATQMEEGNGSNNTAKNGATQPEENKGSDGMGMRRVAQPEATAALVGNSTADEVKRKTPMGTWGTLQSTVF